MSGQLVGFAEILNKRKDSQQSKIHIQEVVGAFENTLPKISAPILIGGTI
jgi:hypothetical protein